MNKTTASKQSTNVEPSVYLFSGEVDARRDTAINDLVAQIIDPGSEMFDLSKFEGDESNADSILAAAMTLPLASSRKVVIVNRVDRLSADDQCRIAAFLPKLGAKSCLILVTSEDAVARKGGKSSAKDTDDEAEEGAQKKAKKGLQPELVKAVKANGKVVEFAKIKAEAVNVLIAKGLTALGKKIDPGALQSLTRSLVTNSATIEMELQKLATYIGERDKITLGDVDAVIMKSPEERVFPLIDAIGARRPDMAIQMLNETMSASVKLDGEVLKILSMLAGHFRRLYLVKFLKSRGIRNFAAVPEELLELLPEDSKNNPLSLTDWHLRKFMEQSSAFSLDELQECIKQILACELSAKGIGKGDGSPRLHLEMLVFKLCQRKPR